MIGSCDKVSGMMMMIAYSFDLFKPWLRSNIKLHVDPKKWILFSLVLYIE